MNWRDELADEMVIQFVLYLSQNTNIVMKNVITVKKYIEFKQYLEGKNKNV